MKNYFRNDSWILPFIKVSAVDNMEKGVTIFFDGDNTTVSLSNPAAADFTTQYLEWLDASEEA